MLAEFRSCEWPGCTFHQIHQSLTRGCSQHKPMRSWNGWGCTMLVVAPQNLGFNRQAEIRPVCSHMNTESCPDM